ncbi:PD-(D/E)XK nuclease-like domain-containing protein [Tranquillimonas rosea]|uniref:PD-(D/E)XK nuclease-like domain-containing protein n=1 Tax=Tranquillimonas rosea TaxID=641238 RepID=UPI003BAD8F82
MIPLNWTNHALERLTERSGGLSVERAGTAIHEAAARDDLPEITTTVTGETIRRANLPDHGVVFLCIYGGDTVKTVLAPGMTVTTSTGTMTLPGAGLPPGLHRLSEARYHGDPCDRPSLSSTLAKILVRQSPLHAWTAHPRLNPEWEPTDKKTFDIGRAAHRAVLGTGARYVAIPDETLASNGAASTKAAKQFIEDARAAGTTPLKSDEVDQIERMARIARAAVEEVGITLDPELSEMAAIAEIEGVMCRAMFDNLPEAAITIPGVGKRKVILDFKTCEDASILAARRAVENYGYDVQDQWYRETLAAAAGEERDMLFFFQEKKPPHSVSFVHLMSEEGHTGDWRQIAREKTTLARATFRECLETDRWPGYDTGIYSIPARPFVTSDWEDRCEMLTATNKPSADALARARAWQAPGGWQGAAE